MKRVTVSALLVIGMVAAAAGMPSSAAATTGFAINADYATGSNPKYVATGDFNNDGNLDLVISNETSNTLSVLLNNGNGTFTAATSPSTGDPEQVTSGDFNNDGNLDLAVANFSLGTVSVLLGKGDGTFTAVPPIPTAGSGPVAVTSGDFNGDGNLDLAVADVPSNLVTILLGSGNGNFTATASPSTGTGPVSIVTGDLNGDGKLDLATSSNVSSTITVLLNDGTGTNFQRCSGCSDYATGTQPNSLTIGDFNGDGVLDLATSNVGANSITVLLNNGSGTNFQRCSGCSDYGTGSAPQSIATGDFNADGILDLATANYNDNKVSVLLGNGNGSLQPKTDYAAGTGPYWVTAANLHSRGTFDLAVTDLGSSKVSVLLNNAPSPLPYAKTTVMYYTLTGSNGTTWIPMDTTSATPLQQRIVPPCTCRAVLIANSSLWTSTANLNQDIGIEISGGKYGVYPGKLVAWQESGSGANLFSPNAATVTTNVNLQSGVAYTVTLVWKANRSTSTGQIWASAGPAGGPRSPTTLRIEMPQTP